jgi:transcriptional regulator with XRE-family HTH domain
MKSDVEDLIIGRNIKRIRQEKGLTQQDLQAATNITIKSLSLIENGHTQARRSNLKAISQALGCPLSDLIRTPMTVQEPSKKYNEVLKPPLSKKELHLVSTLRALSKLQQKKVFEFIRKLMKK